MKLIRMLEDDIIELIEKVADWCSGLTAAPKYYNKGKMCVDLAKRKKVLNKRFIIISRVVICCQKCLESNLETNSGIEQVKVDQ